MSTDGKSLKGRWTYDGSPTSWNTNWNGTLYNRRLRPKHERSQGRAALSPPPTATPTGTVLVNGVPFVSGTIPYGATVDVMSGALILKADVGTLKVNGAGGVSAAFKLLRGKDGKKPVIELRLHEGRLQRLSEPEAE